jgi:hypothetical protein
MSGVYLPPLHGGMATHYLDSPSNFPALWNCVVSPYGVWIRHLFAFYDVLKEASDIGRTALGANITRKSELTSNLAQSGALNFILTITIRLTFLLTELLTIIITCEIIRLR